MAKKYDIIEVNFVSCNISLVGIERIAFTEKTVMVEVERGVRLVAECSLESKALKCIENSLKSAQNRNKDSEERKFIPKRMPKLVFEGIQWNQEAQRSRIIFKRV